MGIKARFSTKVEFVFKELRRKTNIVEKKFWDRSSKLKAKSSNFVLCYTNDPFGSHQSMLFKCCIIFCSRVYLSIYNFPTTFECCVINNINVDQSFLS